MEVHAFIDQSNVQIMPGDVEALAERIKEASGIEGEVVEKHVSGSVHPKLSKRGDRVWDHYIDKK